MAAASDGQGYWLVASDGGVFSFGDARFDGSAGGSHLNAPIVGMAATSDGQGYWLVASDGGVFSFGDARFDGSAGGSHPNAPIVGMAATSDGQGYWLVASDGGVFSFGDAPFRASASGNVPPESPIVAIASGPGAGSKANVAGDFTVPVLPSGPVYGHGSVGFDISYPQCGMSYPIRSAVAVVGVNDGSAFTANPCFSDEATWAGPNLSAYLNLNSPVGSNAERWSEGPDGNCAQGDAACRSFNYGYNAARWSISFLHDAGFKTRMWWLDIETSNYWSSDTAANDRVIAGALDAIRQSGGAAAIYSTDYQWEQIAGTFVPGVPAWYATGVATFFPRNWCAPTSFAGGPVELVQGQAGHFDGAYSC